MATQVELLGAQMFTQRRQTIWEDLLYMAVCYKCLKNYAEGLVNGHDVYAHIDMDHLIMWVKEFFSIDSTAGNYISVDFDLSHHNDTADIKLVGERTYHDSNVDSAS